MSLQDRLRGSAPGPSPAGGGERQLGLVPPPGQEPQVQRPQRDPYADLKARIHHACIAELGPQLFTAQTTEDLSERVLRAVSEHLAQDRTPLTRDERKRIIREIADDILGYGPLEPFLNDDSITEVMVNRHDQVFVERSGKIERAEAAFVDDAHLLRIIDKIVSQVGRRIRAARASPSPSSRTRSTSR